MRTLPAPHSNSACRVGENKMAQEKQVSSGADLGSLLGGLLAGGGSTDSAMSSDALSEGIGKVLSDPQMMAKLPGMIEMLRPMMGNTVSGNDAGGAAAEAVKEHENGGERKEEAGREESSPSLLASAPHHGGGGAHERRIALLCALRPYLNPRRQEAIDYILRMDRMGKLFRNG